MNKTEINAFMANTRELTVATVAEATTLTFPNDGGDFWVRIEERGGAKFKTSATGSGDGFSSLLRDDGGYLELDEQRPTPKMYGAPVDGVNSDSPVFAQFASEADADKVRSVYIPNDKETYFVDVTTVYEEPGVRIYGDAGPTYQRGAGKNGFITFDDAVFAGPVFDLGNSRPATDPNRADEWTVEGIGIKGDNRLVDGISFTSQTNGPDRGGSISKYSAVGLRAGVHIAPNPGGITTSYATLNIEKCNLSNNGYGVLAEGGVSGLRFVGNQAEQNFIGAVHGEFSAGVTIEDNMLEGQQDCINLYPSESGNRLSVSIKRNYFELNSGDYVISLEGSTSSNHAEIGPNYNLNITADDYLIVKNGYWVMDVKDEFPVTITGNAVIGSGSDIFYKSIDYYEIRSANVNTAAQVEISDVGRFVGRDRTDYKIVSAPGGSTIYTPFGERSTGLKATGTTGYLRNFVTGVAGDVIVYSLLMRGVKNGTNNTIVQVFNDDFSANIGQVSDVKVLEESFSGGRWTLVNFAIQITGDTGPSTRFRFFNSSGTPSDVEIASIAARNYGPIPPGGKLKVYPICVI